MNKLVLAAVAATMSAGISSAGTLEVPNTCIVGHGFSTLQDGSEVVDLESVNEMVACIIDEQLTQTAILESKLAAAEGYADTYQKAMDKARADLIVMTENRDNWRNVTENNLDRIAELKTEVSNTKEELKKTQHSLKQWQGWLNYWQPEAQRLQKRERFLEDRLRKAEDRIREIESHRKGNNNPLNWNNW